jgi:hypothetical protein
MTGLLVRHGKQPWNPPEVTRFSDESELKTLIKSIPSLLAENTAMVDEYAAGRPCPADGSRPGNTRCSWSSPTDWASLGSNAAFYPRVNPQDARRESLRETRSQ